VISEVSAICFAKVSSIRIPSLRSTVAMIRGSSPDSGSNRYRVTFIGTGGHSWSDFSDGNPHHAAARAITHFVNAARPITRGRPRSSYNISRAVGRVSGDIQISWDY